MLKKTLAAALALASVPAFAAGIDPQRISQHVRVLASDAFEGRGPATPGETKSVAYIIAQFKAVGLSPGGDHGGWTQAVRLNRFTVQTPVVSSYSVGGTSVALAYGEQLVVASLQSGVKHVSIRNAPMVFVGYGVSAPERHWDDFKGVDLHGKIAVVLVNDPDFATSQPGRFDGLAMTYYGRWTYKYEEMARRGALGVLIVHETPAAGYPWYVVRSSWTGAQFDTVRSPADKVELQGWITRSVASDLFKAAGADYDALKLAAQQEDFQPVTLKGTTFSTDFGVDTATLTSSNVIGKLVGTKRPKDVVLYGAHWDHLGIGGADLTGDTIYNGAYDNATGVAGLIEIGRAFATAPRTQRTIVFAAWTAEEKGLLGSEYYATHPLYPLARTVANINMDGVTILGPTRDVVITGAGKGDIEADALAIAKTQELVADAEPHPERGGYFRSDHFSLAKVGVPAIDLHAGPDLVSGGKAAGLKAAEDYTAQHYHQPSDEWRADWDLGGAKQVLDLLYTLGRGLADSARWPQWLPGTEFKAARDRSDAVRLATAK